MLYIHLDPCPFCNGTDIELSVIEYPGTPRVCGVSQCKGCDAEGSPTPNRYYDRDQARIAAGELRNYRPEGGV